jgi:hypothetical protein
MTTLPLNGGEAGLAHKNVAKGASSSINIMTKISPAKPTVVYDTYWRFAAKRQAIFDQRRWGMPAPWTEDPILRKYKFTNAFRASDRTSQFLIRKVIYEGDAAPAEMCFRVLLFKVFNKIGTWELLEEQLGEIRYDSFNFENYDKILSAAWSSGRRIYSAAYIMPSGGLSPKYPRKHQMHLRLVETMLREELPVRLAEARSMARAFDLLRGYPTIGSFLAYQFVIDLNYSPLTQFSESEFVVAGPGAKDGIRKCFNDLGGLSEEEIIKFIAERQEREAERLGLKAPTLWGRPLQLIDCQNLFCEVDKYSRIAHPEIVGHTGRTRIKQKFRAGAHPTSYWYPPKWGINSVIEAERIYDSHV